MSVENYLKATRNYRHGHEEYLHLFQAILNDYYQNLDIKIVVVNSDNACNEIVSSKDGNYLVWDERFWTYFSDHLYKLLILDEKINNKLILEQYIDFLIADQIRFVIERIKYYDKESALILSKYYVSRFKKISEINFDTEDFKTIILVSKLFVLFHECSHMKYKDKTTDEYLARLKSTAYTIKLCKEYFFEQMKDSDISEFYSPDELSQVIDSLDSNVNRKNMDELVLDSVAFSNCLSFYHHNVYDSSYEILSNNLVLIVNSIRVIRSFSKMLKQFENGIKLMIKGEHYQTNAENMQIVDKIITRDYLNLYMEQTQTFLYFKKNYKEKIISAFCDDIQRPYKYINEKYMYPYLKFVLNVRLPELLNDEKIRSFISEIEDKDKIIDYLLSY